jgi:predicted ATPase
MQFKGEVVRELALQFFLFAKRQESKVPYLLAERMMGHSLLMSGDVLEARKHYDQAIALYNTAEHRPLATRFSYDVRVAILGFRAWTLWLLGYPDVALKDADEVISDAREIGQASSLMVALCTSGTTDIFCGNYLGAMARSNEIITLAEEKAAPVWQVWGTINKGCVSALTGENSGGLDLLITAVAAWQSIGAAYQTWFLLNLAKAYAEVRQFDDAWRCCDEAMLAIQTTEEKWCEAEVNRIAGEIAFTSSEPDAAKAQKYFERALAVARQQQTKSWELRASMSLARLWRDQGKVQQARELLAPVYSWFTEGFDTRDLKEARVLLEELAS